MRQLNGEHMAVGATIAGGGEATRSAPCFPYSRFCNEPRAGSEPPRSAHGVLDLEASGLRCLVRDVLAVRDQQSLIGLRELRCASNAIARLEPECCVAFGRLELLCLSGNAIAALPLRSPP